MNSGFVPVQREVLESLLSTLGAVQGDYMHDKETPPDYLNESIREVSAALKQPGVESAVEVLRLLEWTEIHHDYRPSEFYCPICDRDRRFGHHADCSLAKALAAPQPAQQAVEPVAWGVDWGVKGDRSCVSITKKRPGGVVEVVATEYGPHVSSQQPAQRPATWTARELELIDGMIENYQSHANQCDGIANRRMAEKQKGWDLERVALLRKVREMAAPTSSTHLKQCV